MARKGTIVERTYKGDECYIPVDEPVTHLRVTRSGGFNHPWVLDGADDRGRYTEAVHWFATFSEAVAYLPTFAEHEAPNLLHPPTTNKEHLP